LHFRHKEDPQRQRTTNRCFSLSIFAFPFFHVHGPATDTKDFERETIFRAWPRCHDISLRRMCIFRLRCIALYCHFLCAREPLESETDKYDDVSFIPFPEFKRLSLVQRITYISITRSSAQLQTTAYVNGLVSRDLTPYLLSSSDQRKEGREKRQISSLEESVSGRAHRLAREARKFE
jgi:hypothetical protein